MTTVAHTYTPAISRHLGIADNHVTSTLQLLEDGGTVPFIARYRKERTGSLDELQITAIRDQFQLLQEIDKRRSAILNSLEKEGHLTADLKTSLQRAENLTALEDIYLPYKPKRRTRAMIARESGLEPLAEAIYTRPNAQQTSISQLLEDIPAEMSHDEAYAGARDIIAEKISEHQPTRESLRKLFGQKGLIHSEVVKKHREEAAKYRDYFDWQEPALKVAGHRLLAMLRGEKDKFLRISLRPPVEQALEIIYRFHINSKTGDINQLRKAIEDGYTRLIAPSMENELRKSLKERADNEAIQVFAENLKQLLLAAPLGQKRVMALDPGFRTGAKLVCLDAQGSLLENTTVYPTQSAAMRDQAEATVLQLVQKHRIEAIGIGNGTAGRETEAFIRELDLPAAIIITMINEDGASIYSASETARAEFPDLDLTVRGAISIGRRLQDPLAELVKIDPKSIGVGQYQHDVNQTALKQGLDDVVEQCVNSVGVELNSASRELLTYVAGVGPLLAEKILNYRQQKGGFTSRKELLKVERLGPKAFEQCAGFLRVTASSNPLDRSGVHPESYGVVKRMAKDLNIDTDTLINSPALQQRIRIEDYVTVETGLPTLGDIMEELRKPGRDPRPEFSQFRFAENIHKIEDLEPGMRLPAIITNVTKFGAFADLGVHQDGLIHISQLADRFVKDPSEVVHTRQQVTVRVLEVDIPRKRISLSLKEN
ncbi:Tex family protein [Desulfopila sp. IMCC35008]|uniref:Tex family protein n=1 Tax=Desulfopila sp. IMCC35008 TaxID=2653858 RepID=UPI0013D62EEF|nr:Tex family protein [Desulfopila sp. IMCC35008]